MGGWKELVQGVACLIVVFIVVSPFACLWICYQRKKDVDNRSKEAKR